MQFVFILWEVEVYRNHLPLPHIKLYQKAKRGLKLVSVPHFLQDF